MHVKGQAKNFNKCGNVNTLSEIQPACCDLCVLRPAFLSTLSGCVLPQDVLFLEISNFGFII